VIWKTGSSRALEKSSPKGFGRVREEVVNQVYNLTKKIFKK
jgi:hypothetical protein